MPGAYAHITLVNVIKETIDSIFGLYPDAKRSYLKYLKFCELGAVSPDYPYLAVGDSDAAKWADAMHYTRTGDMIKSGIKHIKKMSGEQKLKSLAWLLGYTAHVTTDVTVHPIVQLKVGDYEQNKKAHRVCEMNQDAYIFQRLDLGEVGESEHLNPGIISCSDPQDEDRLDKDIVSLWNLMLKEVHAEMYALNPPDINKWHNGFSLVLDKFAEEGNKLFPLARLIAVEFGLTYPSVRKIDKKFTKRLQIPSGELKDYDSIFDEAIKNVSNEWKLLASGIFSDDKTYLTHLGAWNLDTGRDESNSLVYWG
jgi:hypothetical protein